MKHILDLLDATAARVPNRPAYCSEAGSYTWAETAAAVRRIGTALAQAGAAKKPVALYLPREASCILAMLGTLAAGGFYTVLDIAQPPERIAHITGQLHPALVLTDDAHAEAAKALDAGPVLTLEKALAARADIPLLERLRAEALDADLAYVLFTSGSTGLPKGVAVTHRNVLAYSAWAARAFHITEANVFGSQTPFYFSMSVTDVFTALRTGASVQVVPKRLFSFPVQLLDFLRDKQVNTLYWVPSALSIVSNWKALDYTTPPALHTILFAGEVMPTARLNYWRAHYPGALFANLYGPTETTDICAYYVLDRPFADDEALPIGCACENCGLLVLKEDGSEAAPGEEGELCARGSFVAAGYYAMPQLTAERFPQNPLQKNYPERIYRTGDLVKYDSHGTLCYCGRMDHQIKHMGYRIEPGEVETAAAGQEKLSECACLFDEKADRLVLFFEARGDVSDALRRRLAEKLPAYMRPAVYCRVHRMPHNANGKIDRKALAAQLAGLA